jgi:excisionase family DNA binding protein
MPALFDHKQTVISSPADRENARHLLHFLTEAPPLPLSENVRATVLEVLHKMEEGHTFTILSLDKEMTPTQAADILGVSRAYFMRAIQQKAIPYRMVGTHYRVRLKDVLKLQEEDAQREQALKELVEQAQELKMGY